jgi:hypothetical protein
MLTDSGFDVLADRPAAGPRWSRIAPESAIGGVVPPATQAEEEGVP